MNLDRTDNQVAMEPQETVANPDLLDPLDLPDRGVNLVCLDLEVTKDCGASLA